jgi:hypothetical protein
MAMPMKESRQRGSVLGRLVLAFFVLECSLWVSDRLGWWHKGYAVLVCLTISGVALVSLAVSPSIALDRPERLWLGGTNVTDAGLVHLAKLTRLRWLSLVATPVTDQGVKRLRQALPNCEIED